MELFLLMQVASLPMQPEEGLGVLALVPDLMRDGAAYAKP